MFSIDFAADINLARGFYNSQVLAVQLLYFFFSYLELMVDKSIHEQVHLQ